MKDKFPFDYNKSRVLYKDDFENGLKNWADRGPEPEHFNYGEYFVTLEITDEEAHSGKHCLKVSNRRRGWNGPILDITNYLRENVFYYEALVWVKLKDIAKPCRVHLSLQTVSRLAGIDFPDYIWWEDYYKDDNILSKYGLPIGAEHESSAEWDGIYPPGYTTDNGWVLLRGKLKIHKSHYDSIHLYIETVGNDGVSEDDIYVDDFVLLYTDKQKFV